MEEAIQKESIVENFLTSLKIEDTNKIFMDENMLEEEARLLLMDENFSIFDLVCSHNVCLWFRGFR